MTNLGDFETSDSNMAAFMDRVMARTTQLTIARSDVADMRAYIERLRADLAAAVAERDVLRAALKAIADMPNLTQPSASRGDFADGFNDGYETAMTDCKQAIARALFGGVRR